MPEIASITPIVPTVQTQTPVAGAAPAAPDAPDSGAPDFLGQLKAALKSLTSVVSTLPSVPGTSPLPVAPDAVPTDQPTITDAPKVVDQSSSELSKMLAELGFIVVPMAVQPLSTPETSSCTPAAQAPSTAAPVELPVPIQPIQPQTPQPQAIVGNPPGLTPVDQPLKPPDGPQIQPQAQPLPPPQAPASRPEQPALTSEAQPMPRIEQPLPTSDKGPIASTETVATTVGAPQLVVSQHQAGAAQQPQIAPTAVPVTSQPQTPGDGGSDQGNPGAGYRRHEVATTASASSTQTDQTATTTDQSFAASVAATTSPSSTTPPSNVNSSDVASQIAHQADLYRLPGNKGVRIQLHPEDLGGVQVTVRYAAGGGLELHINVEHAATGALVQAGWPQLRDALATQGISPDRLVMSVSAPNGSAQLDFSSNGGGSYRSDPGLAGGLQGGLGGQAGGRQDTGEDQPSAQRWDPAVEPRTSSDDSPRAASVAASSRIDYRV